MGRDYLNKRRSTHKVWVAPPAIQEDEIVARIKERNYPKARVVRMTRMHFILKSGDRVKTRMQKSMRNGTGCELKRKLTTPMVFPVPSAIFWLITGEKKGMKSGNQWIWPGCYYVSRSTSLWFIADWKQEESKWRENSLPTGDDHQDCALIRSVTSRRPVYVSNMTG